MTLLEVVVTIAILGIIGSVIVVGVETSSRLGGEARRIDDAAAVLAKLRDASVRYNLGYSSTRADTSFTARISGVGLFFGGINPGKLSQLTNVITTSDVNSCGYTYNATQVLNWKRNFYPFPITKNASYRIADGFYANDAMQRFDSTGAPKTFLRTAGIDTATAPGTLAIVMPNVALSDAQALAARMEGDQSGGNQSIVRFTPSGNAPVTVYYHMEIHGC